MATYEVVGPRGEVFEIEGPDDADPSAVIAQVVGQGRQSPQQEEATPSPLGSTAENLLAGAGKAFVDVARGTRQFSTELGNAVGLGRLMPHSFGDAEVQRQRDEQVETARLDAPLMNSKAGVAGNLVGGVAASVPAALVPGANTATGAGAIGAAYGALQPVSDPADRAMNTAVGFATGAGTQALGQKVSKFAVDRLASRTAAASTEAAQNAVRDSLLKEAQQVGYRVPPATTNPTAKNRLLESVSGKAATQQTAAVKNQTVTNRLVRKELGMSPDAPITKDALNAIRSREGFVYKAIKSSGRITADDQYIDDLAKLTQSVDEVSKDFPDANIGAHDDINKLVDSLLKDSFDSSSAVEYVKKLRQQASANLSFAASADPTKKALGLAQREAAASLEDMVIRHLQSTGKGALADRFDKARTLIAKTYSVEGALNEGSGNVVASQLAGQLRKGKPLSGGLDLAARFAQAFPKAAAEVKDSPGVSAVDALVGGIGGVAVNPALAALPIARVGTREALLTKLGQRAANPNYSPSRSGTTALRALEQSKRVTLPSVVYATQE
jgi:hypothetical protein